MILTVKDLKECLENFDDNLIVKYEDSEKGLVGLSHCDIYAGEKGRTLVLNGNIHVGSDKTQYLVLTQYSVGGYV